ncbi:hypothetical protein HDU86_008417 [Geranomyces michiganensis]|nr:hypothetical protein HDU86_008417 [Geranomyces michiganensis]
MSFGNAQDSEQHGKVLKAVLQKMADTTPERARFPLIPKRADAAPTPVALVCQALELCAFASHSLHLDLAKVFLVHSAMLPSVPLELRAQPTTELPGKVKHTVSDFLTIFYDAALMVADERAHDLVPVIDDRFFLALLRAVLQAGSSSSAASVVAYKDLFGDGGWVDQAEDAWNTCRLYGVLWDFSALLRHTVLSFAPIEFETLNPSPSPSLSLLPYQQPYLQQYLPKLPDGDSSVSVPHFESQYIPNYETHHWHVAKPLPQPKQGITRRPPPVRKSDQRHAFFIHKYASSLTGASGRMITPRAIVVKEKKSLTTYKVTLNTRAADSVESPASSVKHRAPMAGVKKAAAISNKDAIIARNNERLLAAENNAATVRWGAVRERIGNLKDPDLAVTELEKAILHEKRVGARALLCEQELFLVMLLLERWSQFCVNPNDGNAPATTRRKEEGIHILI